ncbi:MAG: type II secretion system major pseudopilin GspG [Spirochaetes bacterium]|nr:type II secretion system major pseudopilin GspG [Spirochaetota bacterium]MBN2770653.1 type II secretion system major pseudopilin GspG [Spirochaetota bacterium]HRX15385.1 type II secretion system major pseudopilin GspG [Spirochaetota bacterium]
MLILKKLFKHISTVIKKLKARDGFSLLEIMIAVTIMSILAIAIVPQFMDMPDKAKVSKANEMIKSLELSLNLYMMDNGTYPTTDQGLAALIEAPTSEPVPNNYKTGGYIQSSSVPKDPWKNDFIYVSPGEEGRPYEIICLGADNQEGGEGVNADITSWE